MLPPDVLERLYREADGARWSLPREAFEAALEASARRRFPAGLPSARELEADLAALHLADLALACACALGHEAAWEHFILQQRPGLYRAAAALDATGGARDLADSLYAELYGVKSSPLFGYFHGRSSLATWLRAILVQRYVDRVRAGRRLEPLNETADAIPAPAAGREDAEHARFVTLIARALAAAVGRLSAKDRLRLRSYYEQDLTLAQIGRVTGEHEATVSRQLAKTRRALRDDIDRQLRSDARLTRPEIRRCWESVMDDAGDLDLRQIFSSSAVRKDPPLDRSTE
jgi:RNA polymerase sigma-70 factor (ECF subfamily)